MNVVRIIRSSNKPVRLVNTGGVVYFIGGQGSASRKEFVLTNHTSGRFRHGFGAAPSVIVLDAAGRQIGAAVQHIYNTPGSTITNEVEILANQPLTGKLIIQL